MSETTNLKLFKHDNPSTNTNPFDVEQSLNENWDKIDTEIGNIRENINGNDTDITDLKSKVTDLETNLDTAQNNIDEIKQEQITQNKVIEANTTAIEENTRSIEQNTTDITKLQEDNAKLKAQIPTGTAAGAEISLNDSAEMELVDFGLQGNSYQEVNEGKNKAIIPDKEENFHSMAINIKNGVITITGTSDVTYTLYKVVGTAKLEAGKKYYLRLWGSKSGSAALFKDSENQWFPDSENQEYEFTPTVGGTYNIQLGFGGGENQNWNARYSISETSNSDWVEGKEATPTLVNPSEVEAVGDSGSAKITESNKNLAKIILTDKWELTENGIKNKGWINAVNLTEVPIFKGQILKLNLVLLSSVAHDTTFSIYINDVYTPEYNFTSLQKMEVNTLYTRTINVEEDGILRITVWENGEEKEFFEFQLWAEEDTVTSYVEHKENIYTIPIQKPFYKIGDYADKFIKQDEKWYEQHYINKFDLSSTYWSVGSVQSGKDVNTKRWNSTNTLNNNYDEYDNNAISNYFNTNLSSTLWGTDLIGFNLENNKVNIRLPVETASSADEVKTFWQEKAQTQVPYIYYILATPELLECTAEQTQVLDQIIKDGTYKEVTHFYTTEDLKPTLNVKYYKDLETLFNKQAELENTLNNVQAQILELGGN